MDNETNSSLHGLAHDAAWSTLRIRPSAGWRNSYDYDDDVDMAQAHSAAHDAISTFHGKPLGLLIEDRRAYTAALNTLRNWDAAGRPELPSYSFFVPRPSKATENLTKE